MRFFYWGCGLALAIALLVPACIVVITETYLPSEGRRGPYVDDPRACEPSNLTLDQAMERFDLVLPEGATNVQYTSKAHPLFGDIDLVLSFRTDRDGLEAFRQASDLPRPEPVSGYISIDWACGLTRADFTQAEYARNDRELDHRAWVVDRADPKRPRVLVEAWDS